MDKEKKRTSKGDIIFMIIVSIMLMALLFGLAFLNNQNQDLKKKAEFNQVKQGLCVYVESHKTAYKTEYTYCLVYDEETDKVIEVDLYEELIHGSIRVGDTIVYVVDYDYTDADFLNVIYQ